MGTGRSGIGFHLDPWGDIGRGDDEGADGAERGMQGAESIKRAGAGQPG